MYKSFLFSALFLLISACGRPNLLHDLSSRTANGKIRCVIEIPAGTQEKWEVSKKTGKIARDSVNGRPRTVNYLGYPANYGFIPQTILPKKEGGDGDPLDVLVLGPPVGRGKTAVCRLIGVLEMTDDGERDDKLIAVSESSVFSGLADISEAEEKYPGLQLILKTWFAGYKGPGRIKILGFSERNRAEQILESAEKAYGKVDFLKNKLQK